VLTFEQIMKVSRMAGQYGHSQRRKFTVKPEKARQPVVNVGDCVRGLRERAAGAHVPYDLIFADPPFNIGVDYASDGGKSDSKPWLDYRKFTVEWLDACARNLRPGGAMFVHVPDSIVALVDETMHQTLGMIRINWIVLHQEFGEYRDSNFIPSKCHLLYYIKPPKKLRTWNVREILEPSLRMKIGDKRIHTAKYKGERPMLDVWYGPYLGRVQGNNEERWRRHANQLPELYLARIIRCASKPGDRVLDPFCGSGTTAVVGHALGRFVETWEKVPALAKSARDRIKRGCVRNVHAKLVNGDPKVNELPRLSARWKKASKK
jgi:DNA modification methylase